jgi:hypothetical protein
MTYKSKGPAMSRAAAATSKIKLANKVSSNVKD